MAQDWLRIGLRLAPDLASDWYRVGWDWLKVGFLGLALSWFWVGSVVAQNWFKIGFWVGSGLANDWFLIDFGLASDWRRIG